MDQKNGTSACYSEIKLPDAMKQKLTIILLSLCFIIFVVVLGEYVRTDVYNNEIIKENITISYNGLKHNEPNYTKKETEKKEEKEEKKKKINTQTLVIDHNSLKNRNKDYRGWIEIPDTKISYPIVKGIDNQEYLHKDFDGKYLYAGTLFIDAYSEKGAEQDNLVIYGHNMKSGSMFGTLKKFREKAYFDEHSYINLYTVNGNKEFLIFSVREGTADINDMDYILSDFSKETYIKMALKKSIQKNAVILNLEDIEKRQIITLVACTGNSNTRLLVSGIQLF